MGLPLRGGPRPGFGMGRAVQRRPLGGCLPLPVLLGTLLLFNRSLPCLLLSSFLGAGDRKLTRHIGPADRLTSHLGVLLLILRLLAPGLLQGVERAKRRAKLVGRVFAGLYLPGDRYR